MFRKVQDGALCYLRAENIQAPHGFTTRLGGVSPAPFDKLNLSMHRGDRPENVTENFRRLSAAVGVDPQSLVLTHQTHSDIVRVVTAEDAKGLDHHTYPECDGLVTNDPGVALWVFTADCTPVLLYDPVTGAVGAVHAGWRGTAAKIAAKAVQAMTREFGCKPENIRAAIGPNIGQCCFQTDDDVPQAMVKAIGQRAEDHVRFRNGKYYVNLKAINRLILQDAGVKSIAQSDDCTMCAPDLYWSHRRMGKQRGSQGAIIVRR